MKLQIGIAEEDELFARPLNAGFQGGPIALVAGMMQRDQARVLLGQGVDDITRFILAAIVDDDDFPVRKQGFHTMNRLFHGVQNVALLVVCGKNHGDALLCYQRHVWTSQARAALVLPKACVPRPVAYTSPRQGALAGDSGACLRKGRFSLSWAWRPVLCQLWRRLARLRPLRCVIPLLNRVSSRVDECHSQLVARRICAAQPRVFVVQGCALTYGYAASLRSRRPCTYSRRRSSVQKRRVTEPEHLGGGKAPSTMISARSVDF